MAVFICEKCGNRLEIRCKPKKCPACGTSGTMGKQAPAAPTKKGKK